MVRLLLPAAIFLSVGGCYDRAEAPVRLTLRSGDTLDFLETCVSQDWNAAFPRLFPAGSGKDYASFRSYNGIVMTIMPAEKGRVLIVRAPTPLSKKMVAYLRKCVNFPGR